VPSTSDADPQSSGADRLDRLRSNPSPARPCGDNSSASDRSPHRAVDNSSSSESKNQKSRAPATRPPNLTLIADSQAYGDNHPRRHTGARVHDADGLSSALLTHGREGTRAVAFAKDRKKDRSHSPESLRVYPLHAVSRPKIGRTRSDGNDVAAEASVASGT